MSQEKQRKQFLLDFLSGGTSGVISKTVCAPIERVKILLQTQSVNSKLKQPYNGIIDCFVKCVKHEGFLSLWRGNGINCLRYFPTQALNFSFKEFMFKQFPKVDPDKERKKFILYNFLAGGSAGCITITFLYPLDFARTRISADIGTKSRIYNGLKDCLRKNYQEGGVRALYQGFTLACFGLFLYRGCYFGIYDAGKELILTDGRSDKFIWRYFYAQIVVITSEFLTYPFDTIKRKIMLQNFKNKTFKNSFDCAQRTYKKVGINGFFTGYATNIIRSFGSSLTLVLFDEFKKHHKKLD
ncbi:Mitochondrial carrier domain [Pseudocohnilembus persalinus]|uniref:ADP/ATP translocase n=1 Tax=Pseudocohnilembus persalinus TaxID=266149 RepID=A0A0V0QY51_PSEPJ|nr:Mitochondrial carrier domain [Pseudocohnilembus persalinus]|eukprot:KRX06805.1 Mitochondrial carrier domain [Pseudocohnilembus persalinus]